MFLAQVNGKREAALPVTDAAVRGLFKRKLPGIFYEIDFFCICHYWSVFPFSPTPRNPLNASATQIYQARCFTSPGKVIYLTKCLVSAEGCFILDRGAAHATPPLWVSPHHLQYSLALVLVWFVLMASLHYRAKGGKAACACTFRAHQQLDPDTKL